MTTGIITIDNRRTVPTSCGNAVVGDYYRKSWAGGDGKRDEEHNYTCDVSSSLSTEISWLFPNGTGPYSGTVTSCFGGAYSPPPPEWDANDEYKLVNGVMSQFRQHDFNAAVNLGELKESIRMIATTARSLARSFAALKKGNVKVALDAIGVKPRTSVIRDVQHDLRDSAASAWLGLTYGWSPLLGAVDDAAKAAAVHLQPRRVRVSSRRRHKLEGVGSFYPGLLPDSKYRVERSVNLIWKIEEVESFSTLEEFGFVSPSLVAWELMPFSFVVDWFLPIGSFLEARSNLSSLKGTYVRTERTVQSATVGPQQVAGGYAILSGSYKTRSVQLQRTTGLISSMPLPAPGLKDPFSASHAVSAIALLQTVFLSRRP